MELCASKEDRTYMAKSKKIQFVKHVDVNGALCAYEASQGVPFDIKRVFTVTAQQGDVRGDHSHIECSQLLICVSGHITLSCDNGNEVTQHELDDMHKGLLVPPGIWTRQDYKMNGSVLMVLCDREYDPDDYIFDYKEFKQKLGVQE